VDYIRHTWALRTDPRLRPFVERVADEECLRVSDIVRIAIIEHLERRGLLQRAQLVVDRHENVAA
jgi:hypothetical protein